MLLGIIHDRQKEYEKAQGHYQEILKINPRFASAANNLAWILVEQGATSIPRSPIAQTAREAAAGRSSHRRHPRLDLLQEERLSSGREPLEGSRRKTAEGTSGQVPLWDGANTRTGTRLEQKQLFKPR